MATRDALATLRAGRAEGRTRLWVGGGEPTLRSDLLGLVRAARSLGYDEVLLQTNGMRLAYTDYRAAVVAAGVTTVRLNVKSHRGEIHDRLSGAPCHALMVTALEGLTVEGVRVDADVLLTRSTLLDLAALVSWYGLRGVKRFDLWLLSAADTNDLAVKGEVPTFAEIVPPLRAAAANAAVAGVALFSLHTPPCTLPADLRALYAPTASLGLRVVGPDGRGFAVEDSSFEGGAFVAACAPCRERGRCGGPRADYLAIHGDAAFSTLERDG